MSARVPELHEEDLADVRDETTEPPMYRVMIHNDDYNTTKEFVVEMVGGRLQQVGGGGDRHHVGRPQKWGRAVRRLPLRGGRNQGQGGDGCRTGKRLPAATDH